MSPILSEELGETEGKDGVTKSDQRPTPGLLEGQVPLFFFFKRPFWAPVIEAP